MLSVLVWAAVLGFGMSDGTCDAVVPDIGGTIPRYESHHDIFFALLPARAGVPLAIRPGPVARLPWGATPRKASWGNLVDTCVVSYRWAVR